MWKYTNELYHYGIPGMKWGVTRNKSQISEAKDKARAKNRGELANQSKSIKGITGGTDDAVRGATRIIDSVSSIKSTRNMSKSQAYKMSDQDLQKAINRMNMERSYNSLMNERRTSRGMSYAKDALGIIGGVVGFAGAALGIATSIKMLRS